MGMRGHEYASNHHRASGPALAASRRIAAPPGGQPRPGDHAGVVFEGPPSVYQVLRGLIGGCDCDGIGFGLDIRFSLPSEE